MDDSVQYLYGSARTLLWLDTLWITNAVEKLKLFFFLCSNSLFSFCEWVLHGRVKFLQQQSFVCVFVLPSLKHLSFQASSMLLSGRDFYEFLLPRCERATKMHSRCSKIPFRNRFQIVQCSIAMENWITDDKIVCFAITKHQIFDSGFITTPPGHHQPPPQNIFIEAVTSERWCSGSLKIELITIRILLCSRSSCCWCTQISFVRLSSVAVRVRRGKWLSSVVTVSSRTTTGSEIAPRKATSLPLKQIKTPKFR